MKSSVFHKKYQILSDRFQRPADIPALQRMNPADFSELNETGDFPSNKHIDRQREHLASSVCRPAANHSSGGREETTSGLRPVTLGIETFFWDRGESVNTTCWQTEQRSFLKAAAVTEHQT